MLPPSHSVVHFSVYSNKDIKKWIGLFEEKKAYVLADGIKYDSSSIYKAFPHIHLRRLMIMTQLGRQYFGKIWTLIKE